MGNDNWVDGVGTDARLSRPFQGVFVKNPTYVAEGREDVYDFYFADNKSHSIRYLTPDGIVTTYAGRGSSTAAADNNVWGTDNGDLRQVTQWLRAHIHRYASFRKPGALFREVCGEFDPSYYTDYLTKKYTALYRL